MRDSVARTRASSEISVRRPLVWLALGAVSSMLVLGVAAAGGALPSCTDTAWGCERVHDPPGSAGSNTAIAFDSGGAAWVSFRDTDAQALMVARYVGAGGDCAGNGAWACTAVDDPHGRDVGFETDIGITSDGTAWVSYQDTTTDDLRVAHIVSPGTGVGCTSPDWTCEVVDATTQVGGYTALAIENDTPLVTYWESSSNDLRFARRASGGSSCDVAGWSCGLVDSGNVGAYANDLAIDTSGRAWAAYRHAGSGTGPNSAKLVVARHVGAGGTGCGGGSPEWSCTPVAKTGNVGLDTGIAFDGSGRAWVHYWNSQNLNLARLDPGGSGTRCSIAGDWECTTIHDASESLGEYGAISFAGDGSAWIAYHGATAERAYVAHYVGSGAGGGCGQGSSAWSCSTLDASGDVGAFWMGVAARPGGDWGGGEPWVSYYDATNGALKIAVLQGSSLPDESPVITGFSPTSGPVGTAVTIDGTNLLGTTSVSFAGTVAPFTVVSDTQVSTMVPSGAKSGPITVVTSSGSATSSQNFRVTRR
ncbi:MAG: IPT/TIG domain-containing protein [Gaiellaceae bacterium]